MKDYSRSYWEKIYLQRARHATYSKRVASSLDIIKKFFDKGLQSYVSWSGGKDSTAMAHLITRIAPEIKIVSLLDESDLPGLHEYISRVREAHGFNLEIIRPQQNLWGIFGDYDFTEDVHTPQSEYAKKYFFDVFKDYALTHGYNGIFIGLRKDESRNRLMNYARRGDIYFKAAESQWVCQPLVRWSAQDVFCYLFQNGVEIFDAYFKTKFHGAPDKIRIDCVLPSEFSSKGQAVWLKHYYPEIFNRLAEKLPKLRAFT